MSDELSERVRGLFLRKRGMPLAVDVEAFVRIEVEMARHGHDENCDVFQLAPDLGPSHKPCNCRSAPDERS